MRLRERFATGIMGLSLALALGTGGATAQQGPPPGCPPPGDGPNVTFGGPPPGGEPPPGMQAGGPPPPPPGGGPPPGAAAGGPPPGPPPSGGPPGMPPGGGPPSENDRRATQAMMQAAFDLLGISPDQMMSQAQAGHSLSDIAGARGIDVNAVLQTMANSASSWLSGEVAAGRLSQDDANTILQRSQQFALQIVTTAPPAGGPPPGGPPPGCPPPPPGGPGR